MNETDDSDKITFVEAGGREWGGGGGAREGDGRGGGGGGYEPLRPSGKDKAGKQKDLSLIPLRFSSM